CFHVTGVQTCALPIFSPPTERVRVTGLFDDDGYVVTIADSGVGISEERLEQINRLINDPPVLGLALEPTLGMYVVARLAARHGKIGIESCREKLKDMW